MPTRQVDRKTYKEKIGYDEEVGTEEVRQEVSEDLNEEEQEALNLSTEE